MELEGGLGCFVCGKGNPHGLQMDFELNEAQRTITAKWVPDERYQGYDGIVHGGIIATLLDEGVAKLCYMLDLRAATAEMTVRYRKPVPVGRAITLLGAITGEKGRVITGKTEIFLEDGTLAAMAQVKCIRSKS